MRKNAAGQREIAAAREEIMECLARRRAEQLPIGMHDLGVMVLFLLGCKSGLVQPGKLRCLKGARLVVQFRRVDALQPDRELSLRVDGRLSLAIRRESNRRAVEEMG